MDDSGTPSTEPSSAPGAAGADRASVAAFLGRAGPGGALRAGAGPWSPPAIPGYDVESLVGSGGLGVVFRARQRHPSRVVAIKVVRPELLADRRLRERVTRRFHQEVSHAARLHHPFILPVYDAGFFPADEGADRDRAEAPYLAMEFLDAPSLTAYADASRFGRAARMELLAKVVDGVHYAHLNGVVHRDLKPSNIVVRANGMPAIRDFSLAWSRPDAESTAERVTAAGELACTFDYAAPEQIDGGTIDERADIYALGVLAYELLAGSLPYRARREDLPGLLRAIDGGEVVPLRERCPCIDRDLEAVVRMAMARDPSERYPKAELLAADLRRALGGDRPLARRATLGDEVRRLARRHRGAVRAIAAVSVVLAGGVAGTVWQAGIAQANADRLTKRNAELADVVQDLSLDIAKAAESMPRSTAYRATLLDHGVAALGRLAEEIPDNPQLRTTLAKALIELAAVQGDPSRHNQGDVARAERTARQALALWDEAAEEGEDIHAERGMAHLTIGRITYGAMPEESERQLLAAQDDFQTAIAGDPSERALRTNVAYVVKFRAERPEPIGRKAIAADIARLSEELQRLRRAGGGAGPAVERDADAIADADTFVTLAEASIGLGDAASAETTLGDAEAVLLPLAARGIDQAIGRCANMKRARARVELALRGEDAMIAMCDQACDAFDAHVAGKPVRFDALQGRALAYVERAKATNGRRRGGDDAFAALEVARSLEAFDPGNVIGGRLTEICRDLAIAWIEAHPDDARAALLPELAAERERVRGDASDDGPMGGTRGGR